ncbi:hypothetical protein [uncultured Methanobrevibacter sp.]|uniref:hypothetical protein n=1 Tax=uncultured Methanobrevibacter sp. TaxID=253161 RepID=UPI00260C159D|nr:hypothetical protein [uncultured Methanobrevibacter sp.]
MDFNDENFTSKMGIRSVIAALVMFIFSFYFRLYDFSYFGISSFYLALFCSMFGGLQLIIGFDYYNNGAKYRPFGLIPLYLIGVVLGVIIFYLVILSIPLDIASILKIEAVR